MSKSWWNWFSVEEKQPEGEAEKKLQQIAEILFPPLKTQVNDIGEKYQIDYSSDSNLEAALYDLEDGTNDEVCQRTIRSVADKLFEVRKIMEAWVELDAEAKYFVVDDGINDDLDKIKEADTP